MRHKLSSSATTVLIKFLAMFLSMEAVSIAQTNQEPVPTTAPAPAPPAQQPAPPNPPHRGTSQGVETAHLNYKQGSFGPLPRPLSRNRPLSMGKRFCVPNNIESICNRPKMGLYRSLKSKSFLRDESVRFADIYLAEGTAANLPSAPGNLNASAVSAPPKSI